MDNTAVIYARVSSIGELQSNERQIEDLKILGKQKNYKIEKIYEEKISGAKKNSERQILTECLEYCFSRNVRILLISELCCLGRNVDEVLKNVMLCKERGLNVYFQKENLSIFDEQGKEHPFLTIFIAILGTVAQMERDNIKIRLDSGREMYKRSGGKLHIIECYNHINSTSISAQVFLSQKGTVFTIQRINVTLKEAKQRYRLKIKNFSCHSLRKTFGRQVYTMNGENSELALIKLMELFNHSSVAITKRYLGLRQEEILETYDCLSF